MDHRWNDNNGTCNEGHTYEQLLVGWIAGVAWLQPQTCGDKEDETTLQHLPPTTASPCLQGGSGANGPVTTSTTNEQAPCTHSQTCEPLLIGWIVGADGMSTGVERRRMEMMTGHHGHDSFSLVVIFISTKEYIYTTLQQGYLQETQKYANEEVPSLVMNS